MLYEITYTTREGRKLRELYNCNTEKEAHQHATNRIERTTNGILKAFNVRLIGKVTPTATLAK